MLNLNQGAPSQELGPCHACKMVGGWAEPETLLDGSPDKIEAQLSNTNAPTKSLLESTLKKKSPRKNEKAFLKKRKKERMRKQFKIKKKKNATAEDSSFLLS